MKERLIEGHVLQGPAEVTNALRKVQRVGTVESLNADSASFGGEWAELDRYRNMAALQILEKPDKFGVLQVQNPCLEFEDVNV